MNIRLDRPTILPPLQTGDRLTRAEFERRYFAMPDVKKAELIEGEVYMPSPVNHVFHAGPHATLCAWIANYAAFTPGVDYGDNATVRLDLDNEPQPDVLLFVSPQHGGRVQVDDAGFLNGAPELVAEVSASTASIDTGRKRTVYRRNQVCEYLVWRVYDSAIDWYVLRDGDYALLQPDAAGIVKSTTFPGLWLNLTAMLNRDLATVLTGLNQGLTIPEHAAFRTKLAAASRPALASQSPGTVPPPPL